MPKAESKNLYQIGEVKKIGAPNFEMNPAELYQFLPKGQKFIIKRAYWIDNPKSEKMTGQHAHTDEDEIFIVLKGKAIIVLDDTGKGKKKIKLVTNNLVWVPRYVWHGFVDLSSDCLLFALSSTNYDPERSGYIEDYEEFKKIKAK
jgi:mannose-6-phosphate isomerase-like protein (cupin superfamily)